MKHRCPNCDDYTNTLSFEVVAYGWKSCEKCGVGVNYTMEERMEIVGDVVTELKKENEELKIRLTQLENWIISYSNT